MVQFAICGFLVGAVLGLRFKVLVLLPATFAIGVIAIVVALILHLTPLQGLGGFAICALTFQGGYLFGSLTRFTIAGARAARILPRPLKTAR